jgi:hypothetical protein
MTRPKASDSGSGTITEVRSDPIIYKTKIYEADGMLVLAPEPMEVGPHVKAKTFNPQPKGGSRNKARGGGAATKGLIFRGVR